MIKVYQFFQEEPKYYYTVMEYVAGGELFDRIVQKVGKETRRRLYSVGLGAWLRLLSIPRR